MYLVSFFYCTFIHFFRLLHSAEFPERLLHPATCCTFSLTYFCLTFTLSCVLMVAQLSVSPDSVVVLTGVGENPFYFAQLNKLGASVCTCLLRVKNLLVHCFYVFPILTSKPISIFASSPEVNYQSWVVVSAPSLFQKLCLLISNSNHISLPPRLQIFFLPPYSSQHLSLLSFNTLAFFKHLYPHATCLQAPEILRLRAYSLHPACVTVPQLHVLITVPALIFFS